MEKLINNINKPFGLCKTNEERLEQLQKIREDVKKAVLKFDEFIMNNIKIAKSLKQPHNEAHNDIIAGYQAILDYHRLVFGKEES